NILDHCYTVIKDAYRSVPRAALGLSDHCLVHLIPTYRQKLKSAKPVVKTVKRWTNETERVIQACFEWTDWSVFEAAANDLDELTETVTSYISFCEDICIPTRTYLTFNNDKPWFTAKLRHLRQAKEDAYRKGDRVLYNQARNTLNKKIRAAKRTYAKKVRRSVCFKRPNLSVESTEVNQQLAEDLNEFYCRWIVRILFVDFSSAFNTIIPTLLQTKLNQLCVPSSISQWITSFLIDRHQLVRMGTLMSSSRTTNTGAPQGCVLSPLLFSLYTNDCTSKDPSVKLLKFEDFRRNPPALPPLSIMDSTVAAVETFKFLGSIISRDLKWDTHIDSIAKKAQQRLYFLRQLKKFNLPQELLKQFYSAVIESVLFTSITVWFGSATKSDTRRLQRTVRTAERIIGAPLPTLQELYTSRVRKRAQKITLNPLHPRHLLFKLLPSDPVLRYQYRWYRAPGQPGSCCAMREVHTAQLRLLHKSTDVGTSGAADAAALNPLVEKKGGRSHVWKYFVFATDDKGNIIDHQKPICKRCHRSSLSKGGNRLKAEEDHEPNS
ncbi:hypothetical protein M9458_054868, partial [Cirrhinus mrigala]